VLAGQLRVRAGEHEHTLSLLFNLSVRAVPLA